MKLLERERGQQHPGSETQAPSMLRSLSEGHGLGWFRLGQAKHEAWVLNRQP